MHAQGFEVVSLIAIGMGVAVWATDRHSPTSRALGLFLCGMGLVIVASAYAAARARAGELPFWVRGLGALDAFAFMAGSEWGIRVGNTVASEKLRPIGRRMVRMAQGLIAAYAVLAALKPEWRVLDLVGALQPGEPIAPGFVLLSAPWVGAIALVTIAGALVLRERPDKAEAARILSMMAVMPLFALALALPTEVAPLAIALGEVIFIVGALRYHNVQGARGIFMAQFLAPQVAQLVRTRGLRNAMGRQRVVLSVVSCDIRGFTRYAQDSSPEKVLRLLRDFYGAVGRATAQSGGTIKDLAGDGALILIGAPVPFSDHAARALQLARRLQREVRPLVKRRSEHLGLGVGVAGGEVAVGIVGEGARYEYVAVGPAVNLAARLCDKARDGEIHVAEGTLQSAGEEPSGRRERRMVKGLSEPVRVYVLGAEKV